jgi:hypothetical protein
VFVPHQNLVAYSERERRRKERNPQLLDEVEEEFYQFC